MQGIKEILHTVEKFTTDNSPALLTAVGVVGTISTALLAGKAHVEATDLLRQVDPLYDPHNPAMAFDWKQKTKTVWKIYVPPVSVAAITCTSIVCANRIGTRRTAALAAAYATSDKAFAEYKEQVVKKLGAKEEQKVRDEVAAEQMRKNPVNPDVLANAPQDRDWFYDARHGRYFQSTIEDVKAAQNHINYLLNKEGDVSLNTFYSWIGVDTVPEGEELGWRRDKGLVELVFSSHLMSNMKPATVLNFQLQPIRNYDSAF